MMAGVKTARWWIPAGGVRGSARRGHPSVALAVVFAIAAILTGRFAFATDWTSFGLDAARSRATAEIIGSHFAPAWRSEIPTARADAVYHTLLASPAVADGFIAVANYGNTVRVLRESDGFPLWETRLSDAVIASPVIDHGWVYVASLDRTLYAFRLADGRLMWKVDLGGITYSSPVVAEGSLIVAAGAPAPHVLRVDAETGHIVWDVGADLLRQSIDSSIAVAAGHVVVGETNGRFHSFAFSDGRHEWMVETGGTVGLASPVTLDNRAYLPVGGADARLVAVDLGTGVTVPGWSVNLTSAIAGGGSTGTVLARRIVLSSLAVTDGTILVDARVDDSVDTDKNGVADLFRSREAVSAVDAASGQVAWTYANGTLDATDPNQIPTHGLVPTPSVHRSLTGEGLAVIASTLAARVAIVDVQSGNARVSLSLPSATRASPASANGRLILATDVGAIVALASTDNSAPSAPSGTSPATGALADAGGAVVTWKSVVDVDGDAVTYQIRWDTDGEILHNAGGTATTPAGVTTWRLPAQPADAAVTYSVRARDSRGAWSGWSAVQTFATVSTPPVLVGGRPVGSLAAALAVAQFGEIIQLATGRYLLGETLQVPAGVTMQGAAAHLTVLEGRGLATAVTFSSSSADQPSALRSLTVRGAATGVATGQGAHAVLQNVIVSENTAFGIDVGASGVVTVISSTLYHNDVAARSFGRLDIRNSIVTANRRGLVATPADAVTSRYNDLFANKEVATENVIEGQGDLALAVSFQSAESGDLRVLDESPTTDRGDPADDFSEEPAPNGNRINMGAFAGTTLAELSVVPGSSSVGSNPAGPKPVSQPVGSGTPIDKVPPRVHAPSGGCTVAPFSTITGSELMNLSGGAFFVALVFAARRRRRIHGDCNHRD